MKRKEGSRKHHKRLRIGRRAAGFMCLRSEPYPYGEAECIPILGPVEQLSDNTETLRNWGDDIDELVQLIEFKKEAVMSGDRYITEEEQEMLFELDETTYSLGEYESDFIGQSKDRFERWGFQMLFSEKQAAWLKRVWEKYSQSSSSVTVRGLPKLKTWEEQNRE